MHAAITPGAVPARRLSAAIVLLLVILLASVALPDQAPARSSTKELRTELRGLRKAHPRLAERARRACRHGGTNACRRALARVRRHEVRAATVRRALRARAARRKTKPKPTSPTPAPAPAPAPTTDPSPAPSTGTTDGSAPAGGIAFEPGITSGTTFEKDVPGAARLGAKQVRIEFPIGTPAANIASTIDAYAAKGIRVLLLAGFPGRIPTQADAQNLAGWAKAYGPGGTFWSGRSDGNLAVRLIEFGNETSGGWQYGDSAWDASYWQRAQTYALRVRDAAQAIRATGSPVGVLALVDDWTGRWVDGMYSAVPDLHAYVAGWTTHPYGSDWRDTVAQAIQHTSEHGAPATIPFDVTEWGLATDDGRCLTDNYGWNPCMTYAQAATLMHDTIAQMKSAFGGRLRTFMMYQVRDQANPGATNEREAYFGLQTHELQDKGSYTAQARIELAAGG